MGNNSCAWTLTRLEECIRSYRELYEIHRIVSIGSSWMSGIGGSGGMTRTYPGRNPELLFSLWDLDRVLPCLPTDYKAVFYLRYWGQWTQARIADLMGCSRQRVWYLLDTLPEVIMEGLMGGFGRKRRSQMRLQNCAGNDSQKNYK